MKRYHVIAVAFLAGLIVGCAVPAHAEENEYTVDTIEDGYVTLSDGSQYVVSDSDNYQINDQVQVSENDGETTITNETNGVEDVQ